MVKKTGGYCMRLLHQQILILAVLAGSLERAALADVANVRILGVSHTQAILSYVAPSDLPCRVEVSKQPSFTPLAHDVDPALFTGAGSDGGGKFWREFVVGKMNVATALDGNNYSQALQAATLHYYRITCESSVATGTFETSNIPMGTTYVPNQPVDGTTGNWLQPTMSWTDRTQEVIDPITGALVHRVVMPRDFVDEYVTYQTVTTGSGSSWTNPNYITGNSAYATYNGTAQAKLLATTATGIRPFQIFDSLDFVSISLNGSGTGSSRLIQMCFQRAGSCVSASPTLTLPSSPGTVYYNQTLTLGDLMGWTGVNSDLLNDGNTTLAIWKVATTGSDTISINNVKVYWGTSKFGASNSSGFSNVCGRVDSGGWTKCVVNGSLYAINTANGTVRFMGILYFNNSSVPGLLEISVNGCNTYGDGDRLWDQTDPNVLYCNGTLPDGTVTLLRVNTDPTNTARPQNTYYTMTNPQILLPMGSDLYSLLKQYDPTLPSYFQCGFEVVQANNVIGGCRAGNQDSAAFIFVLSLGDGTAVGSAGCGVLTAGRCSNSGVGIIAVNRMYQNPVSRYTGIHSIYSIGSVPVVSYASQHLYGTGAYGNTPPAAVLANPISANGTSIALKSTWVTGAVSKAGTVTSGPSNSGVWLVLHGTGTRFLTDTTVGDTITAGGHSAVVTEIDDDSTVVTNARAGAFSVAGASWTNTWPSTPSDFFNGEPVGSKFPRWFGAANAYDYFQLGNPQPAGTVGYNSSTALTGTGTHFLTEVVTGSTICVYSACQLVASITDDTHLTTVSPWYGTTSGNPYTIDLEIVRITAKVQSGGNTVWTVQRNCTLQVGGPCTGTGLAHPANSAATAIANIYDPVNGGGVEYFWDFVADPNALDTNLNDPPNAGSHATIMVSDPYGFNGAHLTTRGNIHAMGTGWSIMAVEGGVTNRPSLTLPGNYPINKFFTFGGQYAPDGGNTYQGHPSNQQSDFAKGYQYDFFTDSAPFVGGPGFVSSGTPSTAVEGSVYLVGQPTAEQAPSGVTPKYLPTLAVCGKTALLDISGPASHITTSSTNTFCYANAAGECRGAGDAGGAAVAGQMFVNCPNTTYRFCTGSEAYSGLNDICVGNQTFDGSGTVMFGVRTPPSATTIIKEGPLRARMVGKVFNGPRQDVTGYPNAKVLEGAGWVFHPSFTNVSTELLLLKNPGIPPLDSTNRQTFVPVHLELHPPAALGVDNALIEFGYDSKLYCTPRAEICVAAANNNPYFFAGETYSGVPCASGCTVDVPSIPSRVLWYRFKYRNASNAVVGQSEVNTIAVP